MLIYFHIFVYISLHSKKTNLDKIVGNIITGKVLNIESCFYIIKITLIDRFPYMTLGCDSSFTEIFNYSQKVTQEIGNFIDFRDIQKLNQ